VWKWKLGRLFRLTQTEQDLDDEIRAHLVIETRQRIEAGDLPEVARLEASKDFGNVALVREVTREMWMFTSLERLWQDARCAVRSLQRSVGFTFLALAALALGIGSTTVMFTVLYCVVIRPLPYADPDRLVTLWEKPPKTERQNVVSIVNFKTWKERARSFDSMAAYNQGPKNLLRGDDPVQITGANVTADFFSCSARATDSGRCFRSRGRRPRRGSARRVEPWVLAAAFWRTGERHRPAHLDRWHAS
jgi:putative ABC transport system permease protein